MKDESLFTEANKNSPMEIFAGSMWEEDRGTNDYNLI